MRTEPLLREVDAAPDDVQSRVQKRLEALNETDAADAPRETADGEDG